MNLNQLRYLVKLSETLNFSKAAQELYITQTTLSQQIHHLEEELGVPLFERTTRHVTMTEAGKVCSAHARAALDCIEQMTDAAERERKKQLSSLSVGIMQKIYPQKVMENVLNYQKDNPDSGLKITFGTTGELFQSLLRRELDLLIIHTNLARLREHGDLFDVISLFTDELLAVVGKESVYVGRKELTVEELMGETIFTSSSASTVKEELERIMRNLGGKEPKFSYCGDFNTMFQLVASNVGVAFIMSTVARTHSRDDVDFIPIVPSVKIDVGIVMRKENADKPTVLRFCEAVGKEIG